MGHTTKSRAGDLVAVEFPFSDLQERKRRPGLEPVMHFSTKLATVDTRLIHHVIGHLHADDAAVVSQAVRRLAANITEELKKTS